VALWRVLCSFNPRPHAGGDDGQSGYEPSKGVSIHAPTRGATQAPGGGLFGGAVSIHAPTRGATRKDCGAKSSPNVSIHAPTRGATGWVDGSVPDEMFQSTPPRGGRQSVGLAMFDPHFSFNPRPHAGGDKSARAQKGDSRRFQSTPPRGGRPQQDRIRRAKVGFNPRPHAGGDTRFL